MEIVIDIMLWTMFLKAVVIGSDFNFYYWFKDGKEYSKWYAKREDYKGQIKV